MLPCVSEVITNRIGFPWGADSTFMHSAARSIMLPAVSARSSLLRTCNLHFLLAMRQARSNFRIVFSSIMSSL